MQLIDNINKRIGDDLRQHIQRGSKLSLRESLDAVFFDLCKQLSAFASKEVDSMAELIEKSSKLFQLRKEINKLRSAISSCKQFNKKVELNLELKKLEGGLKQLIT